MANRLTNLNLQEFSIIRGEGVQPANPEATAAFFKGVEIIKEEGEHMSLKKSETPKTENQGGVVSKVMEVLENAGLIAKGYTRNSTSTYNSTSTSTDTVQEDPMAEEVVEGAGEGVTIVVASSTAKAAPVESTEDAVTKAVGVVLQPVVKTLLMLDGRLAAIEKSSIGSRAIKGITNMPAQVTSNDKWEGVTKQLMQGYGLSAGQRLSKTTITSGNFSFGLEIEQAKQFLDYVVDQSTLLKLVRNVDMEGATKWINTIGLGGRIMKKGVSGVDPGDTVAMSGPTQLQLQASEVLAIVSIGDDTLEDNIEGPAFVDHLLKMISSAASNEVEMAAMMGDIAVADSGINDRWDGWYKKAKVQGAHVIEAMADADRFWAGTDGVKGTRMLKALPLKYRQDLRNLSWMLAPDLYLDYTDVLAGKQIPQAYDSITGSGNIPLRGVKNTQVPLLPINQSFTYAAAPRTDGTFVMLTDVRNLIVGFQRHITLEAQRWARKRTTDYVLSLRADVQVENADAVVIYDHAVVK